MSYNKKVSVPLDKLRAMFNGQFKPRIESGQYSLNTIWEQPPAIPNDLPNGTKSTIFEIHNNQGDMVGKCHAMVLPDGSYGGSGQLDPKCLVVGHTLYVLPKPPRPALAPAPVEKKEEPPSLS